MDYSEIREHLLFAFAVLDAEHDRRSAVIDASGLAGKGVPLDLLDALDRRAQRAREACSVLDRFCWAAVGETAATEHLRGLPNPPAWLAPDTVTFSGRENAVLRRVVRDAGQGPIDSDDAEVFWRNVRGMLVLYGRTAGLTDEQAQACARKLAPEGA